MFVVMTHNSCISKDDTVIGVGWGLSPHAYSFKLKFTVSKTWNFAEFSSKCLPETPRNQTC